MRRIAIVMKHNVNITKDNLVEEFYKEYESKNGKFLLFDLANANENANTKVLKYLLQYNNCQFLNSFLSRVCIPLPKHNHNVRITDQVKAIGPKATGYIDLYIQYDDVHIIIENKVYGAGDTKKQLARYIATVNRVSVEDFDRWYDEPTGCNNTHVVYLTADGTKEPSTDSLPESLKELINYYPINYNDDILPWLEEDVMPNITYADDGMMIAGMQQYIAFLKQFLSDESSEVVDAYVEGLQENDGDKYKSLLETIKNFNGKDYEDNVMKSLRKQLGVHAEAIFSGDVVGDWMLHFTPSFIILYKKSWATLDARKYSIPSLFLYAGSTDYFLKNSKLQVLTLIIDHLSPNMKPHYTNLKFGNHDKNVAFTLLGNPINIKCLDVNSQAARKEFYNEILKQIKPMIDKIDNAVLTLLTSGTSITPDMILKKMVDAYDNGCLKPL